jgi:hypothetical protein
MEVEEYLGSSRLYRRLRSEPHGQFVGRYAARLVEERLVWHGAWRCLNVVGALLRWIAGRYSATIWMGSAVILIAARQASTSWSISMNRSLSDTSDIKAGDRSIQPGDRAALKRWLSVLRAEGAIAPLGYRLSPRTNGLQGVRCLPTIRARLGPEGPSSAICRSFRRFLHEVCSGGAAALRAISQEDVIRYIERATPGI